MTKSILKTIILALVLFTSYATYAQQEMQPKKYDSPEWKRIILFKFKPDKSLRANEIINTYYLKACEKSGSAYPSSLINVVAGEWDIVLVWDMKEGIEEMNWELSPNDIKWMKGMNAITGDASQTKTIIDEFSSLIDKEVTYIGKSGL